MMQACQRSCEASTGTKRLSWNRGMDQHLSRTLTASEGASLNRLILASEARVLGAKDEDVVEKGLLSPGKMLWVDFAQNRVQRDSELKESMAKAKPYGKWLGEGTSMQDLMNDGEILEDTPDAETRGVCLRCFGYQQESLALILGPMAMNGEESLGCMENDTLLAALSDLPRSNFDFFYQLFAQVTNPPIDRMRESVVMSLGCWVGPEENLLGEPTPDQCRRVGTPLLDTTAVLLAFQDHQG